MAYKLNVPETAVYETGKYENEKGNTECVIFVQDAANAPVTGLWKKGKKVLDAIPGEIPRGAAIATFDAFGNYPTDNKGRHAAIYLSHNLRVKSIDVLDQWDAQRAVKPRTIHFWQNKDKTLNGKRYSRSNDSDTFFVIE